MRAEIYESEIYQEHLAKQRGIVAYESLWLSGLTYRCDFLQKRYTWQEAKAYISELNKKTSHRWRFPTLRELERLLTPAPHQNLRGDRHHIIKRFVDFMPQESLFWSATEENSMGAWVVDFSQGYYCVRDKSTQQYLIVVSDSKIA